MTALPKYRINDQVVVISKIQDTPYSLGIIKDASLVESEWSYNVMVNGKESIFNENEIAGAVYESKDLTEDLEQKESLIEL